jgi:nucleoside-diphosphate-sugar epimerase
VVDTEFNVGPELGAVITASDLVERFRALGWSLDIKFSDVSYREAVHLSIDSAKFTGDLNWSPVLKSDEAIQWTSDWYRGVLTKQIDAIFMTDNQVAQFLEAKNGP